MYVDELVKMIKKKCNAETFIDWQGNFDVSIHVQEVSPSDEEFKAHFQSVLNPLSVPPDCDVSTDFTIPVLDCHISPEEVSDPVKNLSRIKPADQMAFQLAYFRSYQWFL